MRRSIRLTSLSLSSTLWPTLAFAAGGGGFAWESSGQRVLNSLAGPMVYIVGTIAIILFGLTWAFSDGGVMGRAIQVVAGLSVAGSALIIGGTLFGFASGALLW